MISTSFLKPWWQNTRLNLLQSGNITVFQPCQRQKSCSSWYFFMIQATVVWNISIRKRYADICAIYLKVVSYNRFVELEKEVAIPPALFIKKVLLGKCTGISFIDSTPLRVCRNRRIHIHKTFQGIAQRGKCSMGRFSGLNYISYATNAENSWISWLLPVMWMIVSLLNAKPLWNLYMGSLPMHPNL